jgi:hypothetical protein
MDGPLDEMSDLTCVKEIIEALPLESKKELFKHFVNSNNSASGVNRPTTPIATSKIELSASKRPLNSPESSQRSKNNGKVSLYSI